MGNSEQAEIIVAEKDEGDGKISISLRCSKCGEPIELNNPEFGMDCANRCMEKAFNSMISLDKLR
jgi:formylmethanofuran dehydrogenase subunit E